MKGLPYGDQHLLVELSLSRALLASSCSSYRLPFVWLTCWLTRSVWSTQSGLYLLSYRVARAWAALQAGACRRLPPDRHPWCALSLTS